jgi:signal transduction histidine kinase
MYIEGHNFVHSAQLQKRINTITEEIDRIVELMNAVLTISKDDAGKTNFNPTIFDLKQICLDVIETSYSHQIGGRKVQFNFKGNLFTVFADKNLMEYSLFNLLNNAFKYSEGAGDILLNLNSKNNEIEIQIIDFGIGIPEKDIPKLFNTFFRASNTEGIHEYLLYYWL